MKARGCTDAASIVSTVPSDQAWAHPATRSDTVGDLLVSNVTIMRTTNIGKLVNAKELDKVLEDGSLDELRVKSGNTVDFEGTDDGKVGHAQRLGLSFFNQTHPLEALVVARESLGDILEEPVVDAISCRVNQALFDCAATYQ